MFKVWNLKRERSFEEDFEKDFAVLINGKKEVKKEVKHRLPTYLFNSSPKKDTGHRPFPDDHIPGIRWGIWNLKYVLSI